MSAISLSALLAAATLLSNGGFESGAEAWKLPADSCWRIEPKSGRRGGACAVFDTGGATNAYKALTSREFAVRPCSIYRFEAYVKSDDAKPRHLEVVMTCLGKKGRFLFNCIARRMKDNAVNTGGWARYEGMTEYLPADAGWARMFIHIPRAEKGVRCRFRVDDFAVYDEAVAPIDALFSSAYRDTAAEGRIRFVAPYRLNPSEHPKGSLRAEFRWTDASGAAKSACGEVDDVKAEMSLDVRELQMGAHPVTVTLSSAKTGETIGVETNVFTRVDRLPNWKVYIDAKNRLIYNGKPFFPLMMSWDEVIAAPNRREESMRIYKRSPLNCITTYIRDLDKEHLDFFYSNGYPTFCNLKDVFVGIVGAYPPDGIVLTEADEEPYVRKIVNRCKDHPGLIWWYINDELPLQMVERSVRRHRFIHSLDPDHPTKACLDKPHHVRSFMKAFDIIGSDPYPVGKNKDLSLAYDWACQTRDGSFGLRMICQTVQAFDWRWYFPEGTFPNMRHPSRREMRSMAWQQIAAGSWGLSFYAFGGLLNHFKGEEFERRYADVCAVVSEIRDFIPVFCSDEPAPAVGSATKGLAVRAWRHEGRVRYVVVNTTPQQIKGFVTIDGSRIEVVLDGDEVMLK